MKTKIKNKIRAGDLLVAGGSIFVLLALLIGIGYVRPLAIAPLDGYNTRDPYVLFSIERGDVLLIDKTPSFSFPEKYRVKDKLVIRLQPGTYYWKVEGLGESGVRQLRIDSVIDLQLREKKNEYEVINTGNVNVRVNFRENETLLKTQILGKGESTNVSGKYILGEYNE